jgi:hypothetical protein
MIGSLANIEVAVRIQASNEAVLRGVVVDCDLEVHVFVVLVKSFAVVVCQNGPVWRIQVDFLTRKRRRKFDEGDGPTLRSA